MPKQLYKITQFHGGLNSNSDARDIAENELSEATDVMVDELGKIRLMGGEATHGTIQAQNDSEINPGYGLFQFSHDRRDGHTAAAGTEVETDYMVFSDPDTQGTVDIYSNEDDTWGSPITGMTDNTGSTLRKDVFYVVDGALRVCDSDFAHSNVNKWYGYVKRTHFSGLTPGGSADAYDTWLLSNAEIAAPTKGIVGTLLDTSAAGDASTTSLTEGDVFTGDWENEIVGHIVLNSTTDETVAITSYTDADTVGTDAIASGNWSGDAFYVFPPAGTGFNLHVTSSGSSGNIPAGTYEFATTFIYDKEPGDLSGGDQESLLFICPGTIAVTANQYLTMNIWANAPYDARITGGRVYTRIENSNDEWQQVSEISLKNGVRLSSIQAYVGTSAWGNLDSTNNVTTLCLDASHTVLSLSPITYEINAGISQGASSNTAKYKTAVIANRIAYIGNVQYDGTIYGDAVFKSPVNKFDIFTSDRRLEANINDGDSIVKLEVYADRLLIFKKKKLELLNISQEVEFVEDTFMHKGVSHPAATCKTDFGIAWVNKQGCYLYDGQKVNNLLEKGGRQIIKESDWATFTTNEPMIGYIPKKRQLLVVDDNSTTGTGKTFLYDLVTQSWVKGADATITSQALTNFVTDWNGDLVYAHTSDTGTFVKWDDTADSSTAVDIKTKDIDFGQPAQTKRIYKFYVTHRGSASNIQLSYAKDGDQDTYTEAGSELPVTSAVTDWVTTAITPTTFSCNSIRLRLFSDGTTPANFEINDITIVFRLKGRR